MSLRLAVGLLSSMFATGCAGAADFPHSSVAMPFGMFGDIAVPVESFEERRFSGVIRQRYDFSCGSAALATLLRFHYDRDVDEAATFKGMWAEGDRERIRKLGFSLLDMKRYLEAEGLTADGYEVSLDEVRDSGVPGVALVTIDDYRHFVVVKGVTQGEVLVGDPSLGLKTMTTDDFLAAWNGIYFVLNDELTRGRDNFNGARQWAQFSRAPIGASAIDPVSIQALMLTAPAYQEF